MAKACPHAARGLEEGVHVILPAEERRWPSSRPDGLELSQTELLMGGCLSMAEG